MLIYKCAVYLDLDTVVDTLHAWLSLDTEVHLVDVLDAGHLRLVALLGGTVAPVGRWCYNPAGTSTMNMLQPV